MPPVEQRVVAPAEVVALAVALDVLHHPRDLLPLRWKDERADGEARVALDLVAPRLVEQTRVRLHELPRERHHAARTAAVLTQVIGARRRDLEVVHVLEEDARIGPRPRVDGLLVVADGEDVPVIAGQLPDHRVLHGVQILELVHQHAVPARADERGRRLALEQLPGAQEQHVEVEDVPLLEVPLVAQEEIGVARLEGLLPESVDGKAGEQVRVPLRVRAHAAEHEPLVDLVGDAEAGLETGVAPELAQELGAERVDGARLDERGAVAE